MGKNNEALETPGWVTDWREPVRRGSMMSCSGCSFLFSAAGVVSQLPIAHSSSCLPQWVVECGVRGRGVAVPSRYVHDMARRIVAHVCPSSSFFHSGAGGRRGGWAKCLTHCKIGLQCSWSTSLVSGLSGSSCLLRIHSPIGAVHEVEVPLSLAQSSPHRGIRLPSQRRTPRRCTWLLGSR